MVNYDVSCLQHIPGIIDSAPQVILFFRALLLITQALAPGRRTNSSFPVCGIEVAVRVCYTKLSIVRLILIAEVVVVPRVIVLPKVLVYNYHSSFVVSHKLTIF